MDFTRTFETTTKCNNINHVWSHFYKILVVLKYHRHLWANIFDTDISRCINTYIKVVYLAFFGMFMLLQISVSKILTHRHLCYFKATKILQKWLQTWFILLHLALVWNVRVKSIWTHSEGERTYDMVYATYYLYPYGGQSVLQRNFDGTGFTSESAKIVVGGSKCPPAPLVPPALITICMLLIFKPKCTWWFKSLGNPESPESLEF